MFGCSSLKPDMVWFSGSVDNRKPGMGLGAGNAIVALPAIAGQPLPAAKGLSYQREGQGQFSVVFLKLKNFVASWTQLFP